jgi:hypothetical protein
MVSLRPVAAKDNDPDGGFVPKENVGFVQDYKDLFAEGSPSKESLRHGVIFESFDVRCAKRLVAAMGEFPYAEKLIYCELPAGDRVLTGLRTPEDVINDPMVSGYY